MSDSNRPGPGICEHYLDRHLCLRCENARLTAAHRDYEDQLCRIAACVGKDARQAPSDDPTVAGAAIAELTACRATVAGQEAEIARLRRQAEVADY